MLCGVYETDITPAPGLNIPGYFESRIAAGTRENLMVRALAFSNDAGESFVLINADAITADKEITARARARIESAAGVPGSHVMFSATHAHTAGPLDDFVPDTKDPGYMEFLADRAADAALWAWRKREKVRIGTGRGREDGISFNRRYRMKDGSYRTNPGFDPEKIDAPAGGIDPEIGIMKIEDLNGKLIAVITNFACHLDTVGGLYYCPDYPGELRRVIQAVYGPDVVCAFLTGACGNINHYDFLHRTREYYTQANPPHYVRMGRILAGSVLKQLAVIETKETEVLGVENGFFTGFVRTPTAEETRSARELLHNQPYERVTISETGRTGNAENLIPRHYARSLLAVAADPEKELTVPTQAARIGDTCIAAMPCELFVEFGLDLKARAGMDLVMVSTLTNEQFGYLATRESYDQGGYETMISGDTRMMPGTGDTLVEETLKLIAKLRGAEK